MSRDRGRDLRDKINYKAPTKDLVNKRSTQSGGNREYFVKDDIKGFTPKEGAKGNTVRLLPGTWKNKEYWGYEIFVHYEIGPDKASFLCNKEMNHDDGRCPICEERARASRFKDADEEYLRSLSPVKRVAAYIIDRANEDQGVLLWVMPYTIDKEIFKHVVSKKTGKQRELDSPDAGHDIYFEREGLKKKTKYSGFEIDSETNELDEEWLEFAVDNPIPKQLIFHDYDYIKKIFTAGSEEEDEDKSSKKSKKKRDEDEDEEEPKKKSKKHDEDEEEDEEEEKPRNKSKKRDEDEDEDEELPSWDDVHNMKRRKMEALALDKTDLEVEELEDEDDDAFADMICEELGIKKKKKKDKEDKSKRSSARERLRNLRKKQDEDDEEEED